MPGLIYDSAIYNVFRSMIHFDTDSFKMILVTSDYKPDKQHSKRSDIVGEVLSGNGYIQGGLDVDVNVKKDSTNNRTNVLLGSAIWTNATITAFGAVYYRMSGSGASMDDLICYIEFGDETSSRDGSFTVTSSTLRIQN